MSTTSSTAGRSRFDSRTGSATSEPDSDELLDLLSDAYVRDILTQLGDSQQSAAELATQLDASRATVYRRLNRMAEANMVETTLSVDPDGHHRKEFRAVENSATVRFDYDGIEATL